MASSVLTKCKESMQKIEERECVVLENDGQKIFGMLHRPAGKQQSPAVVMCHGFAGQKIGKYRIYVLIAQRLAELGIASLRFDFRGSGESEGDFADMTIESEVSDVEKCLEFLRNHSQIDSSRIGILGNSFGGAIAVLAAGLDRRIQSIALLAALFNSQQWQKQWEALNQNKEDLVKQKELSRILDGNVPGPAFYRSFFNLDLAPSLASLQSVPMLHIHSEKDERVGIEQAQAYKRCRENAANTQYMWLQKSDHDFSVTEERLQIVEAVAQWFANTLV